jgi:hypothetical protein
VSALGGRWAPAIEERRRQERTDVYENRALLGFMRWLERLLLTLSQRIVTLEGKSTDVHGSIWLDRLSRWRIKLAALMRRSLFAGMAPEPFLRATSIFRLHPDYAAAFSSMSRIRSGHGNNDFIPAVPIDRTFELYEIWCCVNLLLAASELYPSAITDIAEILRGCPSPSGLGTRLIRGEATQISLTRELRLTYQYRFTPALSSEFVRTDIIDAIPDMTLSRLDDSGRCVGVAILDPKYRVGQSLLDGIRDLHVYRDAILGEEGNRLVRLAVALSPRPGALDNMAIRHSDRPLVSQVCPGHQSDIFQPLLKVAINALYSI